MDKSQFTLGRLMLVVTIIGLMLGGVVWLTGAMHGPVQETVKTALFYTSLALPFVLVAAMAWGLAKRTGSRRRGVWFFIISTLALGVNFYWGYSDSQAAAARKEWTGAAINMAIVVPRSLVVLIACAIARYVLPLFDSKPADPAAPLDDKPD